MSIIQYIYLYWSNSKWLTLLFLSYSTWSTSWLFAYKSSGNAFKERTKLMQKIELTFMLQIINKVNHSKLCTQFTFCTLHVNHCTSFLLFMYYYFKFFFFIESNWSAFVLTTQLHIYIYIHVYSLTSNVTFSEYTSTRICFMPTLCTIHTIMLFNRSHSLPFFLSYLISQTNTR